MKLLHAAYHRILQTHSPPAALHFRKVVHWHGPSRKQLTFLDCVDWNSFD